VSTVLSCSIYLWNKDWIGQAAFTDGLLFEVLLPAIILKEGFTVKKKFFFRNIGYVIGYGFFGTMIYLCLFSTVVYYSNNAMHGWLGSMGYGGEFSWSITNVIHIAVILVSTDTIAPLSLIDGEKYPNLFAIVFGEGVSNDAVSLIAFNTMVQLGNQLQGYVNSPSVGLVFLTFLKCGVFSILFGAGMSMLSSYFHKNVRSLQGHPFIETLMVILFAMMNYF
jgi:NhaP-type Na+/H+ or K+/H+ antiporter